MRPSRVHNKKDTNTDWKNQHTFLSVSDTPQEQLPSSASVSRAAMPTQFFCGSRDSRPPSPSMLAISTTPGLSVAVAVTMSPSPWYSRLAECHCRLHQCSHCSPALHSPSSQSLDQGWLRWLVHRHSPLAWQGRDRPCRQAPRRLQLSDDAVVAVRMSAR